MLCLLCLKPTFSGAQFCNLCAIAVKGMNRTQNVYEHVTTMRELKVQDFNGILNIIPGPEGSSIIEAHVFSPTHPGWSFLYEKTGDLLTITQPLVSQDLVPPKTGGVNISGLTNVNIQTGHIVGGDLFVGMDSRNSGANFRPGSQSVGNKNERIVMTLVVPNSTTNVVLVGVKGDVEIVADLNTIMCDTQHRPNIMGGSVENLTLTGRLNAEFQQVTTTINIFSTGYSHVVVMGGTTKSGVVLVTGNAFFEHAGGIDNVVVLSTDSSVVKIGKDPVIANIIDEGALVSFAGK